MSRRVPLDQTYLGCRSKSQLAYGRAKLDPGTDETVHVSSLDWKPLQIVGLATLILFFLAVPLVYSSGQGDSPEGEFTLYDPGEYPIVHPTYEFDVVTTMPIRARNVAVDLEFGQHLEDLTNVRVNFIDVAGDLKSSQKINLMLSADDLPGVLIAPDLVDPSMMSNFDKVNRFLPLDDIIEGHMPALKAELEKWPEFARQLTTAGSNIYGLPSLDASCMYCQYPVKFWMYMPWFEVLNLEFPPKSTEDLYEVLSAFKIRDPNGNGRADEIPLLGDTTGWNTLPTNFLMNAFIYTRRGTYGGYLQRTPTGTIFVASTDAWRSGLRYIRGLYREGLIASDTFILTNDEAIAKVEDPNLAIVGSFAGGWVGAMTVYGGGSGRYRHFGAIPPLTGPDNEQYTTHIPAAVRHHTFISKNERYPHIVGQWADWFYNPRFYESEAASGGSMWTPSWSEWAEWAPRWIPVPPQGSYSDVGASLAGADLGKITNDLYRPLHKENVAIPPNIFFETQNQDEITHLSNTIVGRSGLVEQWTAQFIVGERDIYDESDWSEYLSELELAGVSQYVRLWDNILRLKQW